ncbi:MAG: hypothetical protein U0136_17335 [Bdellovibrionota bacterium]
MREQLPRGSSSEKDSPDARLASLERRHDAERRDELSSLKIPEAMQGRLNQAATQLLDAVNLADEKTARSRAAALGLRYQPLFDFLRGKDRAEQLELAVRLINPNTFEVFGARSFSLAEQFRAGADRAARHFDIPPSALESQRLAVAAEIHAARKAHGTRGRMCRGDETGIPSADAFRRWNCHFGEGERTQRDALRRLQTSPAEQSYVEHVGTGGLDSLVLAIGRFDPRARESHLAMTARRSEEHAGLVRSIERERHDAAVESSLRLGYARYRENPTSVDPIFRRAVATARSDPEHASPMLVRVINEVDGAAGRVSPQPAPTSITHYSAADFRYMKESLDRGHSFAIGDVSSFFRHYLYLNSTGSQVRAADGNGVESVFVAHARAGLRLLAREYQESANTGALRALRARVPSGLLSAAERKELFEAATKADERATSRPPAKDEDPFAVDAVQLERAQRWSESLERFVSRQGRISRHDALQRAASLLTKRYKADELQQIQTAARLDPRLEELAAVVARAEELIALGEKSLGADVRGDKSGVA